MARSRSTADLGNISADARAFIMAADYTTMRSLLGVSGSTVTSASITDATSFGRNILTAASYSAMKTLLAITAADITNATTDGRALITAANYAAMRTALGLTAPATAALSSNAQAIAGTDNTTVMTPLRTAEAIAALGGGGGGGTASSVTFTPTGGIAATNVQTAIAELDTEKAASSHTHTVANLSDASANARTFLQAADYSAMRTALGLTAPATAALASNAQATAGTDNTTVMTPLRTAEAIAALAGGGGGSGSATLTTFSPAGNIAATNVQAAIVELDTEKAAVVHTHTTADVTGLDAALTGKEAAGTAASVAGALSSKAPVACVATTNITLSGEQTIDGVLTAASRVLLTGQSSAPQNGLYISAAGAWSRSSLADSWTELAGSIYSVTGGTVHGGSIWRNTNVSGGTLNTTAVTFERLSPVPDNSVTYARLQDASAGNVVLARAAGSAGDYAEVALAASQLLGRGATGDIAPITLGTNLSMSGTTLNATGGGGGGGTTIAAGTIVRSIVPLGSDWLPCDGTWKSRTTYSALFAAIGTRYGVADGVNNFVMPRIPTEINSHVLSTPLPAGRSWGSMVALSDNRVVYICGSSGTEAAPVATNTVYFGVINADNTITWTSGTNYPISVFGANAVELADGRLMVVGGYTSLTTVVADVYFGTISGDTITWEAGTAYPLTLGGIGLLLLPDNRVVGLGGYNGSAAVSSTRFGVISGNTVTWTSGNTLPFAASNISFSRNNVSRNASSYLYAGGSGNSSPRLLGFTNGSDTITYTQLGAQPGTTGGNNMTFTPSGEFLLFQNSVRIISINSEAQLVYEGALPSPAPAVAYAVSSTVDRRQAEYVPGLNVYVLAGGNNGASALSTTAIYRAVSIPYIKV